VPTPPPTPGPTGSVVGGDCFIAANEAGRKCVLNYTSVANVASPTIQVGDQLPISIGAGNGTVEVDVIGERELSVVLRDGTVTLATATLTTKCESGTGWDAGVNDTCYSILNYAEVGMTLWGTSRMPYRFECGKLGAELARDETPWASAPGNFFNRTYFYGLKRVDPVDRFGRVRFIANVQNGPFNLETSYSYRQLYWNPVTNVIRPYGKSQPLANPADYVYGDPQDGSPRPEWAQEVYSNRCQGWFFVTDVAVLDVPRIYFLGDGTTVPVLVVDGTFEANGNHVMLRVFANPRPGQ